jgi:hypothetical protein
MINEPASQRHQPAVVPAAPRPETSGAVGIAFAATTWRILFEGCPDVAAGVERIFQIWSPSRADPREGAAFDLRITKRAKSYGWHAPGRPRPKLWDQRPPRTAMNVISDIHDALIDWFLTERPHLFCLHAAAVRWPAGLVCFPSVRGAGKSTLCAQMAADGGQIFGDDVLPLDPETGMGLALGLPPLLRLPLPSRLPPRTTDFIGQRAGPQGRERLYLCLRAGEIAPLDARARIAAFVLLHRGGRGRARLDPIDQSTVVSELIMQNLVNKTASHRVLDCMADLVGRAACYELVYSDTAEASRLLAATMTARP